MRLALRMLMYVFFALFIFDSSRLTFRKDRYKEFLRALRMWRHLRMLKRGGRSYDKTGPKGTSPGELAVICPACPIPSVNLPSNWQSVDKENECVYSYCDRSCLLLTASIPDTSITKSSASMPASASRDGKSRAMRGIQNLALGMLTSFRGSPTTSTSAGSLTRMRFVLSHPY